MTQERLCGCLQVWDTFSLENLVTMTGHEGSVLCCAVNEAATRVVSGGEDCAVRLWSLEDGKQLLAFQAQDEPIKTVQFSSSGQKILSCDVTGRVYVWSMHAEFLTNLMRRYADNISAVTMSNDMKLCLVGCNNGCVAARRARGRGRGRRAGGRTAPGGS